MALITINEFTDIPTSVHLHEAIVTHDDNGDINLYSDTSLVCQLRGSGLGFDRVVWFGRDWNKSIKNVERVSEFLDDNGLSVLSGKQNILEGIERGHARYDESVAVIFCNRMY